MRRVLRNMGFLALHAGQNAPFGQRSDTKKVCATSLSAKWRIASDRLLGRFKVFDMQKRYLRRLGVSSMLLPLLGCSVQGAGRANSISGPVCANRYCR